MGRLLLIGLIAFSVTAKATIDFTPFVEEYASQGFVYRKVTLKEEKRAITFILPLGWNVRGGKDMLQLNPPKQNLVEATISATALNSPTPLDDATIDALKQQVLREAPPATQSVQLISCNLNPVPMGPYSSVEIVVSYITLGRTFEKSAIFVQADDTQLVFRLTAPKEDFDGASRIFRSSIGSWQWHQPKTEASVAAAK